MLHAGPHLGIVEWQGKMDIDNAVATWQKLLDTNPNYEGKDKVLELMAQAKNTRELNRGRRQKAVARMEGIRSRVRPDWVARSPAGFSLARVWRSLRPARLLGCFSGLSDFRPTCFLGQRNSPAPCRGKNTLGPMRCTCVCG